MEIKKVILCFFVALIFTACSHDDGNKGGSNPGTVPTGGKPVVKPVEPTPDCENPLKNLTESNIQAVWNYLVDPDLSDLSIQKRLAFQGFRLSEAIYEVLNITVNECSENSFAHIFEGLFDDNGAKRMKIDTSEIIKGL